MGRSEWEKVERMMVVVVTRVQGVRGKVGGDRGFLILYTTDNCVYSRGNEAASAEQDSY